MTPGGMLSTTLLITAGAALADRLNRRRRWRVLRLLASEWRMNFSPYDQLRLSPKIARLFPIPGAANLKVRDVIYGIDGEYHRYIFTAEFTVGVVRTKHRWMRAASFSESRDRESTQSDSRVVLARAEAPWLDQYRELAPPNARAVAGSPL